MKFWKKFKTKFKKNKVYRMYIILAAFCQIAAIILGVLAGLQKDEIDKFDKAEQDKKTDIILESMKKTEFNTDCNRFYEEHAEFNNYSDYYPFGYVIVRQNDFNLTNNCKKAFGKKTYTDFSNFYLVKENDETYFKYDIELITKSEVLFTNNRVRFVPIPPEKFKPNMTILLRDMTYPYNHEFIQMNVVRIIKNTKPFVFAIGLKKVKIRR